MGNRNNLTASLRYMLVGAIIAILDAQIIAEPIRLTMERALSMAANRSQQLDNAAFLVVDAKKRLSLSLWDYAPHASLSYSETSTIRYRSDDLYQKGLSATLSIPLLRGSTRRLHRDGLRSSIQELEASWGNARRRVERDCLMAFYRAAISEEQLMALRELKEIIDNQAIISERERELGTITDIELLEAKLASSQTDASIKRAEAEQSVAIFSLARQVGLSPMADIEIEHTPISDFKGLEASLIEKRIIAQAGPRNPELRAQLRAMENARRERNALSYAWHPTIDLESTIGFTGREFPLGNRDYGARAIINIPSKTIPVSCSLGINTKPGIDYGRTLTAGIDTPRSLMHLADKAALEHSVRETMITFTRMREELRYTVQATVNEYSLKNDALKLVRERMLIASEKASILLARVELGLEKRSEYLKAEQESSSMKIEECNLMFEILGAERDLEALADLRPGELRLGASR